MMESSTQIGAYLTLADCTRSATAKVSGIDNTPSDEQVESMILVAENIFDKVKEKFPKAFVSSFFRSVDLNKKIGGSKTSQHCKGEAMDIDSNDLNAEIFYWIKANLEFDQLIWEKGNSISPAWVHVSLKTKNNRKQFITIK